MRITASDAGWFPGTELTLDDIDFHQGLVTIRGETSKSGRDRRMPLDAVAAAGIDAYIQDWRPPSTSRVLFLTEAGQPCTYHGFLHCFTRLGARLAKAGVPKFMAHRCRNTWATNAHRQGYSVFDIQDMGGWRTLEMARRYAKGTANCRTSTDPHAARGDREPVTSAAEGGVIGWRSGKRPRRVSGLYAKLFVGAAVCLSGTLVSVGSTGLEALEPIQSRPLHIARHRTPFELPGSSRRGQTRRAI
jgi:hypothetical protein